MDFINTASLRRKIRFLHCMQRERGATIIASAILDENRMNGDVADKTEFELGEEIELARRNTDKALARLCVENDRGGFYFGKDETLPLRESLERVRSIHNSESILENNISSTSNYRRLLIAYNSLISNIIHEKLVIPYNNCSSAKGGNSKNNRFRANSRNITLKEDGKYRDDEKNRKRVNSLPESSALLQNDIPNGSNAFEENSVSPFSLLKLLIAFVRLKESAGIERATLSALLSINSKDKDVKYVVNNLVLEIENQHYLVDELSQIVRKLVNAEKSVYKILSSLVEQSIVLSPELRKLHNLIKKEFDLKAFRKAVTREEFWTIISIYIDRLHALELLIIEEIESNAFFTNFDTSNSIAENSPKGTPNFSFDGNVSQKDVEKISSILRVETYSQDGCDILIRASETLESYSPEYLKSCILSLCDPSLQENKSSLSKPGDTSKRLQENVPHLLTPTDTFESKNNKRLLRNVESAPIIQVPEEKDWAIDLYEIKFIKSIGRGVAGTTYLGNWRGESVAVKVAAMTEIGLEGWDAEVKTLQSLHHPNIVRLFGCIVSNCPQTHCLVLEYCDAGNLTEAMDNPTSNDFFHHVVKSMANGMTYLHKRKFLHRDIKPDNVILHGNLKTGQYIVKLTDFGLSTVIMEPRELTGETGTYRWMAPEIISHQSYSYKADVYSFSIVAWQLLTRENPFNDISQVEAAGLVAFDNARPPFPNGTPHAVKTFIESCWCKNPNDRIDFEAIVVSIDELKNNLTEEERKWIDSPIGHSVYGGEIASSSRKVCRTSSSSEGTSGKSSNGHRNESKNGTNFNYKKVKQKQARGLGKLGSFLRIPKKPSRVNFTSGVTRSKKHVSDSNLKKLNCE